MFRLRAKVSPGDQLFDPYGAAGSGFFSWGRRMCKAGGVALRSPGHGVVLVNLEVQGSKWS